MLPVQCLCVLMKRVTVQQRPTWMFFMFCVWFPWYRLQVLTLFSTSAHHLCVMFLQNTTQTWATRRSARISDRSHIRRRLQHRCAPHHGASAQRSVHGLEGDSVLHGGFFFLCFFFFLFQFNCNIVWFLFCVRVVYPSRTDSRLLWTWWRGFASSTVRVYSTETLSWKTFWWVGFFPPLSSHRISWAVHCK